MICIFRPRDNTTLAVGKRTFIANNARKKQYVTLVANCARSTQHDDLSDKFNDWG